MLGIKSIILSIDICPHSFIFLCTLIYLVTVVGIMSSLFSSLLSIGDQMAAKDSKVAKNEQNQNRDV